MLLKNIVSFDAQNYPNRELVISYPKNDIDTRRLIKKVVEVSGLNITTIERQENESLGMARNTAIENCNGEYICTWDDDDLYHYNRITHQFNSMQGNYYQCGILSKIIIYDYVTDQAYLSYPHHWGGTFICKKDLITRNPYNDSNTGEELYLLKELDYKGYLLKIDNAPFLYSYVRHKTNSVSGIHFQKFLNISDKLDVGASKQLRQQFETQINLQ
ncbi:Glycosyl transferase family 2 [Pedobacter westerhofensis]|uniref:Glycosyl transferase family 2 n=2 Tax=Pedobacter westerhofensis TaxID=425512 RepID=A0A521FRA2_9SPHI|nr:Glycosyl transferase family 2 [Pedobacter westerhofensis]